MPLMPAPSVFDGTNDGDFNAHEGDEQRRLGFDLAGIANGPGSPMQRQAATVGRQQSFLRQQSNDQVARGNAMSARYNAGHTGVMRTVADSISPPQQTFGLQGRSPTSGFDANLGDTITGHDGKRYTLTKVGWANADMVDADPKPQPNPPDPFNRVLADRAASDRQNQIANQRAQYAQMQKTRLSRTTSGVYQPRNGPPRYFSYDPGLQDF